VKKGEENFRNLILETFVQCAAESVKLPNVSVMFRSLQNYSVFMWEFVYETPSVTEAVKVTGHKLAKSQHFCVYGSHRSGRKT
jgi:hypothetical protein